ASIIFESWARRGCVLPRVRWAAGSISKFGPLIKRMRFPMGVSRTLWGSYAAHRSVSSTKTDALKREALGTEGRILFAPSRAGVPHLRGFTFESLARPSHQLPKECQFAYSSCW